MLNFFLHKYSLEAGCDEVGRGCLAGPVVAAAVILNTEKIHPLIKDSKLLNAKTRLFMRDFIIENAIDYSISQVSVKKIDEINILNASFMAMNSAINSLKTSPDLLLIDGNRFKTELSIPYHCIVKGDQTYFSIAAASILAKTYRDELMIKLHEDFPEYAWNKNKGYPTKAHRKALHEIGSCEHHRLSFRLV